MFVYVRQIIEEPSIDVLAYFFSFVVSIQLLARMPHSPLHEYI